MRKCLFAGLLVLPTLALAEPPADQPVATKRFWADDNEGAAQKIERVLREPLNDVGIEFVETPLEEVVAFLRDEYEIEIQLDLRALDELGMATKEPVTVNLRYVSLGAALRFTLNRLDLGYVIDDEVLLITSNDIACAIPRTAIYPVQDLTNSYNVDEIINALQTTSPEVWEPNGGMQSIKQIGAELLVVNATQAVHEEVAGVLKALRAAKHAIESPHDVEAEDEHAEHEHHDGHDDHSHDHDAKPHDVDGNPFGGETNDNPFG